MLALYLAAALLVNLAALPLVAVLPPLEPALEACAIRTLQISIVCTLRLVLRSCLLHLRPAEALRRGGEVEAEADLHAAAV